MPDSNNRRQHPAFAFLEGLITNDLSPAELIAYAQVVATASIADQLDSLDSAIRDLHETVRDMEFQARTRMGAR